MRLVAMLVILAAAGPLAACQTPGEVAAKRCRAVHPPGSAAYERCWQQEYARQTRELESLIEQLREQERHGGY